MTTIRCERCEGCGARSLTTDEQETFDAVPTDWTTTKLIAELHGSKPGNYPLSKEAWLWRLKQLTMVNLIETRTMPGRRGRPEYQWRKHGR